MSAPTVGGGTHCLARRLAAAGGRRFGFGGGFEADAQDSGFPCGLADIRVQLRDAAVCVGRCDFIAD